MKENLQKFNERYIDIVEKRRRIKPKDISHCDKNQNIHKTIRKIVKSYENHHIILHIKSICSSLFHVKEIFGFRLVNETELKKVIKD